MISFLHPWVLAALPLAALPVILHLLARREPPTVAFPSVRYLRTATEEHQRRLKLQHWLLLLLRTLLILALVLVAAGPSVPLSGVPGHAPTALAMILDNSASSAAVHGGTPRLEQLKSAASQALGRATPEDALWLLAADGLPRRGDAAELTRLVTELEPASSRLDLGAAISAADALLATDDRPGEILLLTDLQRTAVTAAEPRAPLTIGRPEGDPPENRGLSLLDPGAQPWPREGGTVIVAVTGDSGPGAPLTVRLANGAPRQALIVPGGSASLRLPGSGSGWSMVTAELDPDEFRLDDHRAAMVRVAPVARASCAAAGTNVTAACDVLLRNGRMVRGTEVEVGRLGEGLSVVMPPADPAELGALNRALAQRGVTWAFGELALAPTTLDSGSLVGAHAVQRRYTLRSTGSGLTGVLATAGGTPWAVRSAGVVLLGSRLEPEWLALPLSAEFMPFMDRLINRTARGSLAQLDGAPGARVALPDLVSEVRSGDRSWPVDGGAFFTPPELGGYLLLAGADTIGALDVNIDPRESNLEPIADEEARSFWHGARVVELAEAGDAAFSARARGDLRSPLLWLVLALGLSEVALASIWRRRA
jgi:hypothetical protein